ncbi:MAG: hypothetical protein J6N70_14270 [Oribacterium sp.]|nr:hypothetical protein [Oribacterium sp.]MBP3267742.1 hypothetical protein [Ruminococcus sp.]
MKRVIQAIQDFWEKNRKEVWLKPLIVIVVMVILGVGYSVYQNINKAVQEQTSQTETTVSQEQTQDEDEGYKAPDILESFKQMFLDSIVHIILFVLLAVALIIVKHRNKVKLKERE